MSPDGYYALIHAGWREEWALYLVSLETMQVRRVEAPSGIGSFAPLRRA